MSREVDQRAIGWAADLLLACSTRNTGGQVRALSRVAGDLLTSDCVMGQAHLSMILLEKLLHATVGQQFTEVDLRRVLSELVVEFQVRTIDTNGGTHA